MSLGHTRKQIYNINKLLKQYIFFHIDNKIDISKCFISIDPLIAK